MQITYGFCSSVGPVRDHNEDYCAFWQPSTEPQRLAKGMIAVLADGVGGQGHGELASMLAAEEAIAGFKESDVADAPHQIVGRVFDSANLAVYNAGMEKRADSSEGRMATTLTTTIFRYNQITIGHVGDCRVYLLKDGRAQRLTSDHSYAGVQLKLGLITVDEARNSPMRCVLTRSVGKDPFIRADSYTIQVYPGDRILQCSDGLHGFVSEVDIYALGMTGTPDEASKALVQRAEESGSDDNITVQIMHVESVEEVWYFRGKPIAYNKKKEEQMPSEAEAGMTLDGRFLLTEVIARSGMATIFKAIDQSNGHVVALKVPLMKYESDPNFYSRFEREEEIGTKLKHPYIMRVEPVPDKSRPYLVMEYLEGQTLGNFLRSVRPMPQSDALKLVSRICEALIYLHEHEIVHRDLKPDNIMILNDGTIRLMDFGIAKMSGGRRLTFGGFQPAMGTPDYMAPEQVKGKRGDARTDIYSMGAILYEMLTGQPPFTGENPLMVLNARLVGDPIAPRKINPEISPQVEEIILKALSREPSERYANVIDFKADLDHPEKVQVTGLAERLQAPSAIQTRFRILKLVLMGALIPLAIGVGFLLATHMHNNSPQNPPSTVNSK